MKENTETLNHPILDTRFAKLVIGKSYLGDFVRSVCVCIFYGVIILLATMLLIATYGGSSASASGAFGFVAVFGLLASVPASIVYFHTISFRASTTKNKNFKQSSKNNSLNLVFYYSSDRFICFSL